jgi:S1-C subfamily serine protease
MSARPLAVLLLTGVCLVALPGRSQAAGFLGVQIRMDEEGKGLLVVEVVGDSPADKGGLKANDIITHLDGGDVGDVKSFVATIKAKNPGDLVTLTVLRGDKKEEVKVTLGET